MSNALKYFAIISVENLCKKHVVKAGKMPSQKHTEDDWIVKLALQTLMFRDANSEILT